MSTLNITYRTPKNIYGFEIVIDDAEDKTITCSPINLYPFEYGNDEEIDSNIFPGSVQLEFTILYKVPSTPPNPFGNYNWSMVDSNLEYYRLNKALAFSDTTVTITKNGTSIFSGYISTNDISGSYENKSFRLKVLSNFGKLKYLDPRTLNPTNYISPPYNVNPGQQVLFTDLLLKLIQEVYPSINQVVLMSDVKSETTYSLLGVPQSVGAGNFGTFNYYYVGPASRYQKASDIIKDILAIFGAVGIVYENKFLIQSRFYFSQTKITISKNQFVRGKGPTPFISKKLTGMNVQVLPGGTSLEYNSDYGNIKYEVVIKDLTSGNFNKNETITWEGGNAKIIEIYINGSAGTLIIETFGEANVGLNNNTRISGAGGATALLDGNPKDYFSENDYENNIEAIKLIAVGGDPPGINGSVYPLLVRNIWVYIPAYINGLGYDTWAPSVRNSFYVTGGTKKPLWKCVADAIWNINKEDRSVYGTDVNDVNWLFNKFYNFEDGSLNLRPRKISYDVTNLITKMELIEG